MNSEGDFYVEEYKRVMDNVKVDEERVDFLAKNIEERARKAHEEKRKQMITTAALVAIGVGTGFAISKMKKK